MPCMQSGRLPAATHFRSEPSHEARRAHSMRSCILLCATLCGTGHLASCRPAVGSPSSAKKERKKSHPPEKQAQHKCSASAICHRHVLHFDARRFGGLGQLQADGPPLASSPSAAQDTPLQLGGRRTCSGALGAALCISRLHDKYSWCKPTKNAQRAHFSRAVGSLPLYSGASWPTAKAAWLPAIQIPLM